ncbi:MAG: DUF169 domain-containing protein [Chlorobiales bacterium]|nr:DUF169 domain-containing protein [Chlorobiales bacterium]
MTLKELSTTLVTTEALERKPIAIKFVRKALDVPAGIRAFGSTAPNGKTVSMLCAMWGDAFSGAGPFYTVKAHQLCGGGTIAAGFGSILPIEAAEKFMIGDKKIFGTMDGLRKAMASTLPFEEGEFEAQIIGPLEKMNETELRPDLVYIVCKPHQGQHILRAYGFDSGDVVYGISGTSTCEMISSYVMKTNRPTFTLGDLGGNTGLALKEDEIIVVFPFEQLEPAVRNLSRIARESSMHKHSLYREKPDEL